MSFPRPAALSLLLASTLFFSGCFGDGSGPSEDEGVEGTGTATGAARGPDEERAPEARIVKEQWDGLVRCAADVSGASMAICSALMVPGSDIRHTIEVDPGFRSIVAAMEWEPTPNSAVTGTGLRLFLQNELGNTIREKAGTGLVELRFDAAPDDSDRTQFGLAVFPPGNAAQVTLEQPFTVYYHMFYGEVPPDGYSALPA